MIALRRFSGPIVLAALLPLLVGCGKRSDNLLATVGGYEITRSEFEQLRGDEMQYTYASADEEFEHKKLQLDSMIVTRLLVQAAYEKGIDRSEELARVVASNKEKFLLDALYRREVIEKSEVTEAEVRDFWNRLDSTVKASHIVVRDPDTAQMVFERLQQGEVFEKLAVQYSIDPDVAKSQGNLGYVQWGDLVDELQNVVFAMQPGELSPPIKTFMGYHLIKVVDRMPNAGRGEFAAMRDNIERQIEHRNSQRLQRRFFETLREKYPIKIDTSACDYLMHKREMLYPPMLLESLPKSDFDLEQLDRDERELVLGTWEGGQMTVFEYLTEVKRLPVDVRPDLDAYDSLATVISAMQLQNIMLYEAMRSGLDSDPEYVKKTELFKELMMADMMKSDSLPQPWPVDEGMVRQYYDEHPDQFTAPAQVHVYEILISDELKARRLRKEIKSLDDFKRAAAQLTERPGRREKAGDLGYITESVYPVQFRAAWNSPLGSAEGPIAFGDGRFILLWPVDKKDPELKDYLGVKRQITERLDREARSAAFVEWVKQRKDDTRIETNEDAIWATINKDKYAAFEQDAQNP